MAFGAVVLPTETHHGTERTFLNWPPEGDQNQALNRTLPGATLIYIFGGAKLGQFPKSKPNHPGTNAQWLSNGFLSHLQIPKRAICFVG